MLQLNKIKITYQMRTIDLILKRRALKVKVQIKSYL